MGIFKRGVLFVCMLMLPVNAFSYQGATSRHVLDNGLTVIITEMPSSSMVSIYTLVKTGSATEGEFLGSGISHFVEHMLFKGTHTQAVGEIAAKIQAMGGTINASTGMDYTIYTITVPHDKFEDGLKIEADMIINPTFDKEEVEKEREVIHSEMRLYKDMPDRKIDELSFNTVFERHPYKLPVIGYEDLFDSVTRDDLVKYYQTHYTANNSILSIAGNVKTEDILPKIKEAFKGYKRNFDNPRNLVQEPVQLAQRYVEEEFEANITRVSMNYRSVSIRHPDVFALDVLASVLSEGASSRLYKNIYKKKDYITGLYASNYTPYDPGIFEISMSVDNKRTQEAISDVLDEINLIKTKGITKQELDKVIANEEAEYVYSHLTTYHIAHAQAIDEAFTGDFQFSKNYIEHLKNVTPKDVKRVASQYLTDNSLSIVILKPKDEKKPEENKQEKSAVGELKKIVLDNGVTLFLKEDRTMPYVTANFLIKGGSLLDKEENAGTFGMLGSLLIKGTKSKTEGQIAEITDSRGIQLSGYAGGLTLVVSASFLPKDTHIVLNLTEDILKNPVFPEDELKKLKETEVTAIKKRLENINYQTSRAVYDLLYSDHPYRFEPTLESVANINREEIVRLYAQYFSPENMVISVFGDINSSEVEEALKQKYGSLKSTNASINITPPKAIIQQQEKTVFMDKEQAMVMFGFHGDTLTGKDRYGLQVMALILGSSFDGRMFKRIRDEYGQAYSLGGRFIPMETTGLIYFSALTTKEAAENVKRIVREEIANLQTSLVSDKELDSTKSFIKGNLKQSYDTLANLSLTICSDELHGVGYDHYKNYDQLIDQVTKEDVMRLAKQYLDFNKAVVVTTLPKTEETVLQEK